MSKAPMYKIKTGHMRFRHGIFKNGEYYVEVHCSEKAVPIGVELDKKELFEDQQIIPVYGLAFESLEQFDAYIHALNESKKKLETMNKENLSEVLDR